MILSQGLEAITELAGHLFVWHNGDDVKKEPEIKEINAIFEQITDFEQNIKFVTEEVRMAQHIFDTPIEERVTNLEETLNNFIKETNRKQRENESLIWDIKKGYERAFKAQASSIKNLEVQEEVEVEKTVEEVEVQKRVVESFVPPIPFPGRLKKEKEREQFRKFLKNLQQLTINIPFVEALEQTPKYAKFIKDLLTNKAKFKETSKVTLNERCSVVLLNKIPLKERDPVSFTIPCANGKNVIDKALANLGASISLMPYSMFVRLDLGELKPTRMCIELANRSTQYPKGIAENFIVQIDKFGFLVDFVIVDIEEDSRVLIILGRPFLATAHAMIDVFNKKSYLEVGNEKVTLDIERSMKFSTSADNTCHSFDLIDLTIHDHVQETLRKDQLDSFLLRPVEGYEPNNDEIRSSAGDELRRSLETLATAQPGYGLNNLESEFNKTPTLFAASVTTEEK
ncbi:putative nucleotidyltransferase, ribonuclease H [Tanacetum coccineum]